MSAIRYLVPALAAVGQVAAQCSASTPTTIGSSADASALASCQTYTGDIAIATDAAGQLDIPGVQHIEGSLIADNVTQLTQLSASQLRSISDTFSLFSMTILSSLNFPQLTDVDTIDWEALPALQGLSFSTGVQMARRVSVQNTQLNTLSGINLQTVDEIIIANNPYLDDITMQLGNVSTSLILQSNGRNVSANFPNLEWAFNMTLQNVSTVSIPSLQSVNGSLGFISNFFESVTAPNLTEVGGSLSFVSNADLSNVSFPELTTVNGGLQLANNSALEEVTGFPKVETVGGALDFYGSFSSVDLPALRDVRGAFNMQSTEDLTDVCNNFSGMAGQNNVIKGKFVCKGGEDNPTSTDGTGSSRSSTISSSAAHPIVITGATGVLGVIAAIFGML